MDKLITPAMVLTAADAGSAGNDILFTVVKVVPDPDPLKTRLTVALQDSHTYTGLTLATIQSTLSASHALVHVTGKVGPNLPPQQVILNLQGGAQNTSARVDIKNNQNGVAFTLEAKKPGAAGNNIAVQIRNVNASAGIFDLAVEYRATSAQLGEMTLQQLGQNSNEFLAYDVVISAPEGGKLAAPPLGLTHLSGGTDVAPLTKATATIYASVQATVCFSPGIYLLPKTLNLDQRHSGLTLEGCTGEVLLEAATGADANFLQGLISIVGASGISLRGLSFELPDVNFSKAGGRMADLSVQTLAQIGVPDIAFMDTAVGVRTVDCINLTIEECVFEFQTQTVIIFEAGILATGQHVGLVLKDNIFRHIGAVAQGEVRFGYILSPNLSQVKIANSALAGAKSQFFETALALPAALIDAKISGNLFSNLTGAMVIYAGMGNLSIESNRVQGCREGFMLFTLAATFANENDWFAVLFDSSFIFGTTLATGFPLPQGTNLQRQIEVGAQGNFASAGSGAFEQLLRLAEVFVGADKNAFSQDTLSPSSVTLSNNVIENAVAEAGVGFILWGDDSDHRASIVMSGNTLRGRPVSTAFGGRLPIPLAAIFDVAWGAVTGNVILNENEGDGKISLVIGPMPPSFKTGLSGLVLSGSTLNLATNPALFAAGPQGVSSGLPINKAIGATATVGAGANVTVGATGATGATAPPPPIDTHIAVTGNTLRGFPVLPPHGLPAPFDKWEPLNLIINL